MSYRRRMTRQGPKRLLSLDGGGIRGVLTLEILAAMESMLRREQERGEDFVLADYFDYIAGTSTGAIIAAGLATGMHVRDLQGIYRDHGEEMFDRASIFKRFNYKYDSNRLKGLLQRTFGADTMFGDDKAYRCLLMMVLRNATTDSPWPLSNNPNAKYNDDTRDDNNLTLPLWQLVRASTAAPTYFPPESVTVGQQNFVFVDGGMTMYNNPAFQLFLMATLPAYRLRWPTGERALLLVSVGTGSSPKANDHLQPGDMNVLFNASSVPSALMYAALNEQDLLCRVFGRCRHGELIDLELGDLVHRQGAPIEAEVGELIQGSGLLEHPLFSYVRYNAELSCKGLTALGLSGIRPADVQRLDSIDHTDELRAVGAAAARQVVPGHFDGFLEPPGG